MLDLILPPPPPSPSNQTGFESPDVEASMPSSGFRAAWFFSPSHVPNPSDHTQNVCFVVQQAATKLGLEGALHVGKDSDLRDAAAGALGYSDKGKAPGENIGVVTIKDGANVTEQQIRNALEKFNQDTMGAFRDDINKIERIKVFEYKGQKYIAVEVNPSTD